MWGQHPGSLGQLLPILLMAAQQEERETHCRHFSPWLKQLKAGSHICPLNFNFPLAKRADKQTVWVPYQLFQPGECWGALRTSPSLYHVLTSPCHEAGAWASALIFCLKLAFATLRMSGLIYQKVWSTTLLDIYRITRRFGWRTTELGIISILISWLLN